jgi:hypothetical protein
MAQLPLAQAVPTVQGAPFAEPFIVHAGGWLRLHAWPIGHAPWSPWLPQVHVPVHGPPKLQVWHGPVHTDEQQTPC